MNEGIWTHVGLGSTDIKRSKRFWEQIFGFKEINNITIEGEPIGKLMSLPGSVKFNDSMIEQDTLRLDILEPVRPAPAKMPTRPFTELGLNYISMRVPEAELASVKHQIGLLGGKVLPGGGYARDPDGQLIQLTTGGVIPSFSHVSLNVADIPKTRTFLQEVFGFTPLSEGHLDGAPAALALDLHEVKARSAMQAKGKAKVELLHFETPHTLPARFRGFNEPGLIHMALREVPFDMLGELRGSVAAHGGKVLWDTIVGGDDPRWKSLEGTSYITDPDGQRIALFPKR